MLHDGGAQIEGDDGIKLLTPICIPNGAEQDHRPRPGVRPREGTEASRSRGGTGARPRGGTGASRSLLGSSYTGVPFLPASCRVIRTQEGEPPCSWSPGGKLEPPCSWSHRPFGIVLQRLHRLFVLFLQRRHQLFVHLFDCFLQRRACRFRRCSSRRCCADRFLLRRLDFFYHLHRRQSELLLRLRF